MATIGGGESARRAMKSKMESLVNQVDKLRREMSDTRVYARLILSTARKLEEEVAALIEKCSGEPEASLEDVVDLEEEGGNSGGMNQGQRGHLQEVNDDLGQFKGGMRKDCGRLRDKVDNLVQLAQLLTNHVMGLDPKLILNRVSAASSSLTPIYSAEPEPASNLDGRRSPTSADVLIKTGNPKGTAEGGALSPPSLDSTGHAEFTVGLEGMKEGSMSTMADPLGIAVGGGQNSTEALKRKSIRRRNNSAVAVDPHETEDSSIHKRKRRINSKLGMGVSQEKMIRRTTTKPPPKLLEVSNRTGLVDATPGEPESMRTDFDTIGDSNDTVPTSPPGPSTQTRELPGMCGTCQKQTEVNADDPLANLEIDSQSTAASGAPSSSPNYVSPSPPPLKKASSRSRDVDSPGHSEEPLATHYSGEGCTSFECIFCHRNCGSKLALEMHTLSHIGERPHFCNLCPYETSYKSNLNRHLETHKSTIERKFSNNQKTYKCASCQKLVRNLSQHIAGVHGRTRPFKCEECPKAFVFKDRLKSHMLVHTGEKNHRCGICDKKFAWKNSLDDHIRVHTGERPFKCRYCGKSFKSRRGHMLHERKHQQ